MNLKQKTILVLLGLVIAFVWVPFEGKVIICCAVLLRFFPGAVLSKRFTAVALFSLFTLAFIYAPYWLAFTRFPLLQITTLLGLTITGAIWAMATAGKVTVPKVKNISPFLMG